MVRRLAVVVLVAFAGIAHAAPAFAQKIDPPKKIRTVDPVYPPAAQAARVQGEVVIEATVGTDGKVHDPKVIGSIPLLDEPALAAVRQWEYEPAVVDGAPKAVVMTVRVKFALMEQPRPQRAGPLVLDRNGDDWTVGGTPLLDDNLRFWLHTVMLTEPEKELVVHADGSRPYAELIDVLASATAAGVERLHVFVGDAAAADAVRVWLEPLAKKPTGLALPVADVGSAIQSTAIPLVITRAGTTAAATAGIQRAGAGTVVRLRIDASRRISDAWQVLQLGQARHVDGFALAVQLPAGASVAANAPVSPQQQQEFERLSKTILDLVLSDTSTDASIAASIPLLEKFVVRNPNVADAHFKLATAYEHRATATAPPGARRADLTRAVDHFARTAELHPDADARFLCTWKIAHLYETDGLNDPDLVRRYAQRLTEEFPAHSEGHLYYATLLHDAGDDAAAANVMRHGRTVSTMPPVAMLMSMMYLSEQVRLDRRLPPEEARTLLDEALAVADAVIADPKKTDADYARAAMGKAMVLDLKAQRVARTPQERLALLIEAERWGAPLDQHKNGAPPPAAGLSASETRELEWNAIRRWNASLADEGNVDDAIAAIGKYSAEHPDMSGPHDVLAELLMRSASKTTDAAARARALDRAATELMRVIELAPAGPEQLYAFDRFLDATGPRNLNRPDRQETAARALLKRQPQEPKLHYALAAILLRAGKPGDADKVLRNARSSIKATADSRAAMAGALLGVVHVQELPPAAARRLFDEAGLLVGEAEKLNGRTENVAVIEARMAWLYLSAERFETDPARAAAQRAEAKRLDDRAVAIRTKAIKQDTPRRAMSADVRPRRRNHSGW